MNRMKRWLGLLLALLTIASLLSACAFASPAQRSAEPPAESSAPAGAPEEGTITVLPAESKAPAGEDGGEETLDEDGVYTTKEDLALYIHLYGRLPGNFITKDEARAAGWSGGSLEPYCPGKCIGGDRFGNREGLLPSAKGRVWTECDINTLGARSRGAERIVFSNDGLIYYTGDHYESFQLLYGKP